MADPARKYRLAARFDATTEQWEVLRPSPRPSRWFVVFHATGWCADDPQGILHPDKRSAELKTSKPIHLSELAEIAVEQFTDLVAGLDRLTEARIEVFRVPRWAR